MANIFNIKVQVKPPSGGREKPTYRVVKFNPGYILKSSGFEILIFKHLLGQVVPQDSYSVAERGFFGSKKTRTSPSRSANQKLGMEDGFKFDAKLKAALETYQLNNRDSIVEYGRNVLNWERVGNDTNAQPDVQNQTISGTSEGFSRELGVIGEATMAVMHGYRDISTPHFYNNGFGDVPRRMVFEGKMSNTAVEDPPKRNSDLHQATQYVRTRAEDMSDVADDKTASGGDISVIALRELGSPPPTSDTKPWEDEKYIYVYVDTEYTRKKPPDFSKPPPTGSNDRRTWREYIEIKEIEALRKVYKYYAKAFTWGPLNVLNDDPRIIDVWGAKIKETSKITIDPSGDAMLWRLLEERTPIGSASLPLISTLEDNHGFVPPGLKPGDVYRIKFSIWKKKMLFGSSTSAAAMSVSDAIYNGRLMYEQAIDYIDAAGEFLEDPHAALHALSGDTRQMMDNAEKAVKDKVSSVVRNASKNKKKLIRNAWKRGIREQERRGADAKWAASEKMGALLETASEETTFPARKTYEVRTFKKYIKAVATKMREFSKELHEWQAGAGPKGKLKDAGGFYPPIDMDLEARNLESVIGAMERIVEKNGFEFKDKFGSKLAIDFLETKNEKGQITGAQIFGYIKFISPVSDNYEARVVAQFGYNPDKPEVTGSFGDPSDPKDATPNRNHPFNTSEEDKLNTTLLSKLSEDYQVGASKGIWANARTMAYLLHLEEMYSFINRPASSTFSTCDEINTPKAIPFVTRYTLPKPGIKPRTPDGYKKRQEASGLFGSGTSDSLDRVSRKLNTSELKLLSSIKRTSDIITEKAMITSENKDNIIKVERGKTYDINDILPLGELCTLEEVWQKFIKTFDFKALMCEYAQCVPAIPWPIEFKWDFDFDFEWPKIPTFDIYVIYPIILMALAEMMIRMLCTIVMKLLDMIKFPNCDEIFDAAMYGIANLYEEIQNHDDGSEAYFTTHQIDPSRPASGIDKEFLKLLRKQEPKQMAAQAKLLKGLVDFGIPPERISDANVSGDTVSSLVTDISNVLTPSELCSMLSGTPLPNTMEYVQGLIRNSHPELISFFPNQDDTARFFGTLGGMLDPEICEKISRIPDSIVANRICPETDTTLRDALLTDGASPSAIRSALDIAKADAERRAAAFKSLASENPLKKAIPNPLDFSDPNAIISDLPPAFANQIKTASRALFSIPKSSFLREVVGFIPALYDTNSRSLRQGDAEFNSFLRIKAEEAIEIFTLFEGSQGLLAGDMYDRYRARESLYKKFIYKIARYELDENGNQVRIRVFGSDFSIPKIISANLNPNFAELSEAERIRELTSKGFWKVEEGRIDGWLALNKENDNSTLGLAPQETDPDTKSVAPSLSATMASKTKSPDPEENPPHALASPGTVTKRRDLEKIEAATTLPGGQEAIAEFEKVLIEDIQSRIMELRDDILRDLEVNHKQRTEAVVAPTIKSFFLKSEEIAREREDPESEIEKGNFYWESSGEGESFIMRIPIPGSAPPPAFGIVREGEEDTNARLVYTDLPGNGLPYYSLSIYDGILTKKTTIYRECDVFSEEMKEKIGELPAGRNIRSWTFSGLMHDMYSREMERYGFPFDSREGSIDNEALASFRESAHDVLYKPATEAFYEEIFDQLSGSPIFDISEHPKLDSNIRGKTIIDAETGCIRIQKGMIDFEQFVEEAVNAVAAEFKKPENSLTKIDYLKPGPFEKGMMAALVSLLIDVFLIEFALRGSISFSSFSAKKLFKDKNMQSYLIDFVNASLEKITIVPNLKDTFYAEIKRLTKLEDSSSALFEILKTRLYQKSESIDIEGLSKREKTTPELIDEVFGTKIESPSVNFLTRMNRRDVPRLSTSNGVTAPEPQLLPDVENIKRKGDFYLEGYVRVEGIGAKNTFEDVELSTINPETEVDWLDDAATRIEGMNQFASAGITAEAIRNRVDELRTMDALAGAADDNYTKNVGIDINEDTVTDSTPMELANIGEVQEFINSAYKSSFDEELCDMVGAVFDEDEQASCYMMPKTSYRFPTRFIKRNRKYLRINRGIANAEFNDDAEVKGIFSLAGNSKATIAQRVTSLQSHHHSRNQDMRVPDEVHYFVVPADYCQVRADIEGADSESFNKTYQTHVSSPMSDEAKAAHTQTIHETISTLPIKSYVEQVYPMDKITIHGMPGGDSPGEAVLEKWMQSIIPATGTYVESVTADNSSWNGYPLKEELRTNEEDFPKLERGLCMGKVQMKGPSGDLIGKPHHPLDPSAPWMMSSNSALMEAGAYLGNLSNAGLDNPGNFFNAFLNGQVRGASPPNETRLMDNIRYSLSSGERSLATATCVWEEWTEYIVYDDMFTFKNPGESLHHPDEMPRIKSTLASIPSGPAGHPYDKTLAGRRIGRPMGYSPSGVENTEELDTNHYATPVRVVITRVDYKLRGKEEDGTSADITLDSEFFAKYDLPETLQCPVIVDSSGYSYLNKGRKFALQHGLNSLVDEHLDIRGLELALAGAGITEEEVQSIIDIGVSTAGEDDELRGRYSVVYDVWLKRTLIGYIRATIAESNPDCSSEDAGIAEDCSNYYRTAIPAPREISGRQVPYWEEAWWGNQRVNLTLTTVRSDSTNDGQGPGNVRSINNVNVSPFSSGAYEQLVEVATRRLRNFLNGFVRGNRKSTAGAGGAGTPAITVSKVYSAACLHESVIRGWVPPMAAASHAGQIPASCNFSTTTSEYLPEQHSGINSDKANGMYLRGSWALNKGVAAAAIPLITRSGRINLFDEQDKTSFIAFIENYLGEWVDKRRYESFWGRTSSPWWLHGGPGYWPASRRRKSISARTIKYDTIGLSKYFDDNIHIGSGELLLSSPIGAPVENILGQTHSGRISPPGNIPELYSGGALSLHDVGNAELTWPDMAIILLPGRDGAVVGRVALGRGANPPKPIGWPHRTAERDSIRYFPDIFYGGESPELLPVEDTGRRVEFNLVDSNPMSLDSGNMGEDIIFADDRHEKIPDPEKNWNMDVREVSTSRGVILESLSRNKMVSENPFVSFAKSSAVMTIMRGEEKERQFWDGLRALATPHNAGAPQGVFEELKMNLQEAMEGRLKYLFTKTKYTFGVRLVYVLPEAAARNGNITRHMAQLITNPRSVIAKEERTYSSFKIKDENTDEPPVEAIAIPVAYYEAAPLDFGCQDFKKITTLYNSMMPDMINELVSSEEYDTLTGVVFPLERISAMSSIYSIMALSSKPELESMFRGTKDSIARLIQTMTTRPPFGEVVKNIDGADLQHVIMGHMTPEGPSLPESLMDDFGSFIEDLITNALLTPPYLIRSLGMSMDPAMKDMQKKVMSCEVKSLDWGGISSTALDGKMDKGVNRNHEYAPVSTAFPIDLLRGMLPFVPFLTPDFFEALYKFSNYLIKDKPMPSISAGNNNSNSSAAANLARKSKDRYGTFLGPFGMLGLGMPAMPGEAGKAERNACDKPTDKEKANPTKECPEDE